MRIPKTNFSSVLAVIAILILSGCATINDVNRAAKLNRMDSNIPLLVSATKNQDPNKKHLVAQARAELRQMNKESMQLAAEANGSDSLQKAQAIAFYRLAATAAWQSRGENVMAEVFDAATSGQKICAEMTTFRPDRDCFYLATVPTYVAADSALRAPELESMDKDSVKNDLANGNLSGNTLEIYEGVWDSLKFIRANVLEASLLTGDDNEMLKDHPDLRTYFCNQIGTVISAYRGYRSTFRSNLNLFIIKKQQENISDALLTTLDISDDIYRELGEYQPNQPEICN